MSELKLRPTKRARAKAHFRRHALFVGLKSHAFTGAAKTAQRRLRFHQLLLQALGFEVRDERVDERASLPSIDFGELVQGETDAVIGDAVLRKIVGADFFGAVAGLDLAAALGGEELVLLFLLHFVEAGAKDAHGFGAILDLRFLVLLRDDQGRWECA